MSNFFKSFFYAWKGISLASKQRNFKIQLLCSFMAVVFGVVLKFKSFDWFFVMLCIALVLCLEMINSAIELLVDLISPEYNEKAGKIKDLSAGAVLIASFISLIIGLIIYGKYLIVFLYEINN